MTHRRFHAITALLIAGCLAASSACLAAQQIALAHLAPASAALFIANADGSGEHALAKSDSLDYNPAWSPKGDWITFTSERDGSADIFRIHPDGTGLQRLTDSPAFDDQAAFSPDEKQIVFVSTRANGHANLWVLDLATHTARPLTSGKGGDFRPAWSPNGKWIAFSSDRGSGFPRAAGRWERMQLVDLYIIHPDGSGLRRITPHGGFCGSPKWTADSRNVVAYCMSAEDTWTYRGAFGPPQSGQTRLVTIDVANGKETALAAGPGVKLFPTPLPAGDVGYLRYDQTAQGVFYTNGRAGPKGGGVRTPSWSPDGKRLVYARFTHKPTEGVRPLWSRNKDYRLFATGPMASYSPDGKRLAVTIYQPPDMSALGIIVGGKPAKIILERKGVILAPQWSPDGRQIAFGIGSFNAFASLDAKFKQTGVDGGGQIGVVDADGSHFHLITSGPNNNAFPSWSPDGKRMVYRTTGPDGTGLRIMHLSDQTVTRLTNAYDNFPDWSPRGNRIVFMREVGGNFEIFTIRPDGTGLKQLTHCRCNAAHPAWSPDGEKIVFTGSRMAFKDEAPLTGDPQPYGEIFVMDQDGTHVRQLTDNQWEDGAPTWRPEVRKRVSTEPSSNSNRPAGSP
ncbi:MAG TPA: hypothetical protein VF292_11420 [Rhodanobacteraceae bacterium]